MQVDLTGEKGKSGISEEAFDLLPSIKDLQWVQCKGLITILLLAQHNIFSRSR